MMLMTHDAARPYDSQIAKLVMLASIAESVNCDALLYAVNNGLIPVPDRSAIRRLISRVQSVRRAWDLIPAGARDRLTTPRYTHRVKAARAFVEASNGT
jgi:hypothetical protein